jgi:D-tagatose-1,6-bisphosphate aldolase subunit GatZ/KbaZ
VHIGQVFSDIVASRDAGRPCGVVSICSAHPAVIRAALEQAADDDRPVLIEATSNQVNQHGGYTGMNPHQFRAFVEGEARRVRFPLDRLLLGGDHLGPYPWRGMAAGNAMAEARKLVEACSRAGYGKLHLDASMPLGGDATDRHGALSPSTAAEREAALAAAAESVCDGDTRPVYVIGTEVPTPGGMTDDADPVRVTRPEDLEQTVELCRSAFFAKGLDDAWNRVCAVVVQPGVEFGDHTVHAYSREKAAPLIRAARRLDRIVLEGHSTDYQSSGHLRELVEDGVAVLKVGPALTFAVRECLFAMERIEIELARHGMLSDAGELSDLTRSLEEAMVADPRHWAGHYSGTTGYERFCRFYSYRDRIRYYWQVPAVEASVQRLLRNLESTTVPAGLYSQFAGASCSALRNRDLPVSPAKLIGESVRCVLRDYVSAVHCVDDTGLQDSLI